MALTHHEEKLLNELKMYGHF